MKKLLSATTSKTGGGNQLPEAKKRPDGLTSFRLAVEVHYAFGDVGHRSDVLTGAFPVGLLAEGRK